MKRSALAALPLCLFLLIGGMLFPSAGRDDKYLTFWPAHTLAEWGQIISYNGERLEQSSSMLLVLVLGLVAAVTPLSVPVAGWLIGVLGGLATLALTGVAANRCRPGSAPWAMLVAGTVTGFVYWSFSGFETSLAALSLLAFALALARSLDGSARRPALEIAATASALALVRPEGIVVAACSVCGLTAVVLVRRRREAAGPAPLGRALLALALVGAVALALVGLRLAWFDSAFPQPVVAKSGAGHGLDALRGGLRYVLKYGIPALPLLACAGAGILATAAQVLRPEPLHWPRVALAVGSGAYLAFVLMVGGDWMEGSRFIAHVAPLLAVLAVDWLSGLARPYLRPLGVLALVLAGLAGAVRLSRVDSRGLPLWVAAGQTVDAPAHYAWTERGSWAHARDIPVAEAMDKIVQRLLAGGTRNPHLLAENTGFVVYHTALRHRGAFTVIDGHGLSDRFITGSALRSGAGRGPFGVMWTPERMMKAMAGLPPDSGVPRVDIAFFNARHPAAAAWTGEHDLTIVYVHQAPNALGLPWTAERGQSGAQVIAVRSALAGQLEGLRLPGNDRSRWMR